MVVFDLKASSCVLRRDLTFRVSRPPAPIRHLVFVDGHGPTTYQFHMYSLHVVCTLKKYYVCDARYMRFSHPHHFCLFSVCVSRGFRFPPPLPLKRRNFFLRIFLYKSPFFLSNQPRRRKVGAKGKKEVENEVEKRVSWRGVDRVPRGVDARKPTTKRKGPGPDPGRDPCRAKLPAAGEFGCGERKGNKTSLGMRAESL